MTFEHEDLVSEIEKLRRFASKLTRNYDDAEDLLQTTIVKALQNKYKFEEGSNLFSWTSKIMFNTFASNYNRRVKFETQYDSENIIAAQATESSQESEAELRETGEALEKLSDDHKDIIVMICMNGMSYEAVAEQIDIPVGTVRSRLSRARDQLREHLAENNDYEDAAPFYLREDGRLDRYAKAA